MNFKSLLFEVQFPIICRTEPHFLLIGSLKRGGNVQISRYFSPYRYREFVVYFDYISPLFSRICNSAAMSWGFAIPPSSVLFVDLSNRITNSYIHGRRITNSPEQVNWIANPNTQFCRITNCFTLRPATVGSPEREKPPENATNATIMPPPQPP